MNQGSASRDGKPAAEVSRRPTVLIVDDTPENLTVLGDILSPDYKVQAANNGELALKLAGRDPAPDMILLDIMMPGLSGYEVCERLKSNLATRRIPVIFVTAMTDAQDETRGFELGAVDYITKPVSPPVVKARVRTHLALYNQQRELARLVREATEELLLTRQEVIRQLGRAAEFKDNETGLHVVRMSQYARLIALAAGLDPRDAELIFQAAPMHDIGKIGVPDAVLKKPAKLDDDEWATMRSHALMGGSIIGDHPSDLLRLARSIALTHHEKWDGTGYPNGLKGEEISIEGRITAVADVFDALTSRRPYKKAWTVEEASTFIQEQSGIHFDPRVVGAFLKALPNLVSYMEQFAEAAEPKS